MGKGAAQQVFQPCDLALSLSQFPFHALAFRAGKLGCLLPDVNLSLFPENLNALNLGFGQSPMSRRLLYYSSEIPLRFRMESLQSITIV